MISMYRLFSYPNFSNDMWRVLGLVFFDDALRFVDKANKTYRKDDIIAFLSEVGIGIYDTACAVRRLADNASDKFLEVVTSTDVEALLRRMPQCTAIVTTGQKATDTICQHFCLAQPKMGEYTEFHIATLDRQMRLYRMPSTSRAYPLSLQKKAEAYRRMFVELQSRYDDIQLNDMVM